MLSTRSFTTAIALAFVTACARPEAPAAAPVAIVAVAPPPTTASPVVPSARPRVTETGGPGAATLNRFDTDVTSPGRVRPANLTALGPSAVPFARYLNAIHNKIHPEFSDKELAKLDALPPEHALNQKTLRVRVELVLDGSTGAIVESLVVRPSGNPEFDAIGLDTVKRSAPFGEAPIETRSPDGKVYVHWELRRDEVYACSTMHAHPYLLRAAP